MADDPNRHDEWLPPHAPGAQPPPRFSPPAFEPPAPPAQPVPAPLPAEPAARPLEAAPAVTSAPAPRGKTDPLALSALLLGLAGLLLLLMSLGFFFFFAVPCSVGAWLAGTYSRRRFRAGRAVRGKGMADAGRILGIVGSVLGVAATITWIVLLANGYTPETLQRDLQRELDRQRQQQQQERQTDAPEAAAGVRPVR